MPVLTSAQYKLTRAHMHIQELGRLVMDLAAIDAGAALTAMAGPRVYRQALSTPGPTLGLALSDSLQNLRASLDHAAWALSTTSAPGFNERQVYFPVERDPASFGSKVSFMTPEVQRFMREIQPFNVPSLVDRSRTQLSVLNDLARRDRHQVLPVVLQRVDAHAAQPILWAGGAGRPLDLADGVALPDGPVEVLFGVIAVVSDYPGVSVLRLLDWLAGRVTSILDALEQSPIPPGGPCRLFPDEWATAPRAV